MALSDATIERKIRAKSGTSEAELAHSIAGKIEESGQTMAADITREISQGLEDKAREAELLILPAEVKDVKRLREVKDVTNLQKPPVDPDAAEGSYRFVGARHRSRKDASKSDGDSTATIPQRLDTGGNPEARRGRQVPATDP